MLSLADHQYPPGRKCVKAQIVEPGGADATSQGSDGSDHRPASSRSARSRTKTISSGARRMVNAAAWCVGWATPEVQVWQWVLSGLSLHVAVRVEGCGTRIDCGESADGAAGWSAGVSPVSLRPCGGQWRDLLALRLGQPLSQLRERVRRHLPVGWGDAAYGLQCEWRPGIPPFPGEVEIQATGSMSIARTVVVDGHLSGASSGFQSDEEMVGITSTGTPTVGASFTATAQPGNSQVLMGIVGGFLRGSSIVTPIVDPLFGDAAHLVTVAIGLPPAGGT